MVAVVVVIVVVVIAISVVVFVVVVSVVVFVVGGRFPGGLLHGAAANDDPTLLHQGAARPSIGRLELRFVCRHHSGQRIVSANQAIGRSLPSRLPVVRRDGRGGGGDVPVPLESAFHGGGGGSRKGRVAEGLASR